MHVQLMLWQTKLCYIDTYWTRKQLNLLLKKYTALLIVLINNANEFFFIQYIDLSINFELRRKSDFLLPQQKQFLSIVDILQLHRALVISILTMFWSSTTSKSFINPIFIQEQIANRKVIDRNQRKSQENITTVLSYSTVLHSL